MTYSSEIVSAWETAIFKHATVQAITRKYFTYDILADIDSMTEFVSGMSGQQHKFFTLLVSRQLASGDLRGSNTTASRFTFAVDLAFYLEKDPADSSKNYNEAIRVIEVVDDLIRSELGKDWSATVNFWRVAQARRPELIDVSGKKVWRCGVSYEAVKQV